MGNSHNRQRLTTEESARKGNTRIETLLEDITLVIVAAFLLDSEVCAWAVCSHTCLNQLQRYRFKSSVSMTRAIQIRNSQNQAAAFGTPQIVRIEDGNMLCSIHTCPSSVHSLILFDKAFFSTPQLPSLPPSVTSLTFINNHWDSSGGHSPSKSFEGMEPRIHLNNGNLRVLHLPRDAQKLGLHFNHFPDTLHTLQLYAPKIDGQSTLADLQLPASLTNLHIISSISSPEGFPSLPPSLQRLEATFNFPITQLRTPLPNSITDLALAFEPDVQHKDDVHLPPSLTSLTLLRFVGSFPSSRCPPSLTSLRLLQFTSSDDLVLLPPTITALTLRTKPGTSFHDLYLPDSLIRCQLDLAQGPLLDKQVRWPAHLQELELDGAKLGCHERDWTVPQTVTKLELAYNCNLSPHLIRLPPNLQSLSLEQFQGRFLLRKLGQNLPPHLSELILPNKLDEPLTDWDPPASLTSLTTSLLHLGCKGLQQPQTVSRLVVTDCQPDAKLSIMFPKVEVLELQDVALNRKLKLPENLRRLILTTRTRIPQTDAFNSMPTLPRSVREIVLKNSYRKSAPTLRQIRSWQIPECVVISEP